MKHIDKSNLYPFPTTASSHHSHINNDAEGNFSGTSTSGVALSLLQAKQTGRISPDEVDAVVHALQLASCPHTLVQRSVDVSINLTNSGEDAVICFKYDLANFGRKELDGRTHRFWFTSPQKDINLAASTESGIPLEVERLDSSSTFKEVRIKFPNGLEPAEQIAYRVQYQVSGQFTSPPFFDITAWTITNKCSLSVFAPLGFYFNDSSVTLESADGYISDQPPLCSISVEMGRQKLNWSYAKAKAGDRFRTAWSKI